MLLSGRADPVHFVQVRVPSSLAGFFFFVVLVAFVGGIGDRFFFLWRWVSWEWIWDTMEIVNVYIAPGKEATLRQRPLTAIITFILRVLVHPL